MSKWILAPILLFAAGLGVVLQFPLPFLNPGRVTAGHAKIERDCFQCHDALRGPGDEKCIACHEPGEIGRENPGKVAFHRELREDRCLNCHTDHKGTDAAKATRVFDHSLLAPTNQKSCRQCHISPRDGLHRQSKGECATCHSNERWKPATFDHDRYFRFDRHHPADCASCHPHGRYDRYTCYDCHEHSPGKIRREHLEEGIGDFENCTACHHSGDEDEAERIWRDRRRRGIPPGDIGKSPWPLEGGSLDRGGFQRRHRDHDEDDDDPDEDHHDHD